MQKIIIFGISSFAKTVSYYLLQKYEISAYCADREYINTDKLFEKPIVAFDELITKYPPCEYKAFVAIGYQNINKNRENACLRLKEIGYELVSYISPSAITHKDFVLNENVLIMENVVVQPNSKIEANTIILPNSVISHDSVVEKNCYISACCCINGYSVIGRNTFMGANATIRDKTRIGSYCIVGAGCTVLENFPDNSVCKACKNDIIQVDSSKIKI